MKEFYKMLGAVCNAPLGKAFEPPQHLAIAQELSDLPDSACEVGKGYSFWSTGQDFVYSWLCPQGLVQC